jgi:hypothetical protein
MGHKCQEVNVPREHPSANDEWELKDKFSIFNPGALVEWGGNNFKVIFLLSSGLSQWD